MMKKVYLSFLIFIIFFPITAHAEKESGMNVHFIDVGQGDSILIETPSDKTILIDAGPPEAGEKVVTYLKEKHIKEIDLLIATHPDYDHIGGLPKVMREFKVKQILDTGKFHLTKSFANYMKEIRKQDIPTAIAKKNQTIRLDTKVKIKVLNAHGKNKNNNQSSIALKISYKEVDFMLMSDVEIEQEVEIMNNNIEAEVVKVAHHGSDTSTSFPFLRTVKPQIAILTYSVNNHYGHPVERVIENLDRIDALIYSTASYGDIVINTDGEHLIVLPKRQPTDNLIEKRA
ncbi:MBL fold metallo-hydrolase [Oceanobacillus piezotolerans]|uniref:MBL fold metallo-hydrolase n=1 Tax=Oceanobacillus piezotolerans TaxID=2448030 RepID=A0A498D4B3_9BACI|nr:MBL fold metallo-hydrolase [Oceanobacillus piezotolerans]RLL40357.1 MBL fold metallo-hydrolase [Oceanobacillus piezotolerans]